MGGSLALRLRRLAARALTFRSGEVLIYVYGQLPGAPDLPCPAEIRQVDQANLADALSMEVPSTVARFRDFWPPGTRAIMPISKAASSTAVGCNSAPARVGLVRSDTAATWPARGLYPLLRDLARRPRSGHLSGRSAAHRQRSARRSGRPPTARHAYSDRHRSGESGFPQGYRESGFCRHETSARYCALRNSLRARYGASQ